MFYIYNLLLNLSLGVNRLLAKHGMDCLPCVLNTLNSAELNMLRTHRQQEWMRSHNH